MADNAEENPYVFESELLSPFARLQPGEDFTWKSPPIRQAYQWIAVMPVWYRSRLPAGAKVIARVCLDDWEYSIRGDWSLNHTTEMAHC